MERTEAAERARTAMACIDCALAALKVAQEQAVGLAGKGLDTTRANDELGKLQLKLLQSYDKATAAGKK